MRALVWLAVLGLAARVAAQPVAPPAEVQPPAGVHPLDVRDLWAMARVSEPRPSPDGKAIVYVERRWDVTDNSSVSHLMRVAVSGGEARRLTTAPHRDRQPLWHPAGDRVGFLSNRSGSWQVWEVRVDGGEPRQLTDLPVDVESFRWSPDGDRLAFVASVYPDCATLDCTAARDAERAADHLEARRYDHLLFRHWDTWDAGKRSHLFVMPAAGGTPVDLLRGADLDAPPPPWGGLESWEWSPDGRHLVIAGRERTPDAAWSTDLDLYRVAADGSGFACITEPNLATDALPVHAPDGGRLAYLAMKRPGYESDRFRIVLWNPEAGRRQVLTETWDRSPAEMVWSTRGKVLYVTAQDHGRRRLFVVPRNGKDPRVVELPGSVRALAVAGAGRSERLVFTLQTLTQPAEIYTCRPDGSELRRLTHTNDAILSRVRMSEPQRLTYAGASGDPIEAWFLPPVDRQAGRRYPLVLLIHGGPQGSWDDRFGFRWNLEIYAAAGYAVLAPDFHGSTGYGQAFTDAIHKDWGGAPYEDLMRGVDHVIETVPWVDGSRLAAAGASFGGYMINWIAGQNRRFRCLVNHDGLFDLASFYAATEELWFPEWDLGGTPWENRDIYHTWSPSRFVESWSTPMLVIHGGRDYRVPETQGFAAFTALQRRGIPSQLLYFPDENHWVLKPRNAILWQDTILAWLARWLEDDVEAGGSR